ncbi:Protein CLEC16A, partial [Operophtera brumata]
MDAAILLPPTRTPMSGIAFAKRLPGGELNVDWLCMDAAILLPPTRTPMSGIAFAKRLPGGELNVEWLCMDAAILLPPTRTPMSGIAFAKRLPGGELNVEWLCTDAAILLPPTRTPMSGIAFAKRLPGGKHTAERGVALYGRGDPTAADQDAHVGHRLREETARRRGKQHLNSIQLNVEWLCMDAAILLPPSRTTMSGIAFAKRLPGGEMERARRAIRSFFLIRDLYLKLTGKAETQLPLTNTVPFVQDGNVLDLIDSKTEKQLPLTNTAPFAKVGDVLDLIDIKSETQLPLPNPAPFVQVVDVLDDSTNDSDLISCDIIQKDGTCQHRFLAVDSIQIILVEPDKQRLGWGVAKL